MERLPAKEIVLDDDDDDPNELAEGTALGLRAHLLITARPELLVAADVKRMGGPDLVCWEWEPGQVRVWQLRYRGCSAHRRRVLSGSGMGGSPAVVNTKFGGPCLALLWAGSYE